MIVKEHIEQDHARRIEDFAKLQALNPSNEEMPILDLEKRHLELAAEAGRRLKKEISEDLQKRGYAGKSPDAIADLLNSCPGCGGRGHHISDSGLISSCEFCQGLPSRIAVIWSGIPYAKNAVSSEDIQALS